MDNFDIDFKLLPPKLQIQLWLLALDANTSSVALAYAPGKFRYSASYNYGKNIEAGLSYRRFNATLSLSPQTKNVDLGLVYRGFDFSAAATISTSSLAISLNYGANLLPFPAELEKTFTDATVGLQTMAKTFASSNRGFFNGPLAWYSTHSNDAKIISRAVSMGRDIARSQKASPYGAGLLLNYHRNIGLTLYGAFTITW